MTTKINKFFTQGAQLVGWYKWCCHGGCFHYEDFAGPALVGTSLPDHRIQQFIDIICRLKVLYVRILYCKTGDIQIEIHIESTRIHCMYPLLSGYMYPLLSGYSPLLSGYMLVRYVFQSEYHLSFNIISSHRELSICK